MSRMSVGDYESADNSGVDLLYSLLLACKNRIARTLNSFINGTPEAKQVYAQTLDTLVRALESMKNEIIPRMQRLEINQIDIDNPSSYVNFTRTLSEENQEKLIQIPGLLAELNAGIKLFHETISDSARGKKCRSKSKARRGSKAYRYMKSMRPKRRFI